MESTKMCDRTVDGLELDTQRTVPGEEGSLRTVDGEVFECRTISGLGDSVITLLGTTPTVTEFTTSGSYVSPLGCVYMEVFVFGRGGGGGAGQATLGRACGGGGAGGGVSVGYFSPGIYAVTPSTFHTISATDGASGGTAALSGTTYTSALNGTATNSLYPFGLIPATPPGTIGGNGGGNFACGQLGIGWMSNTVSNNGLNGFRSCGGGGGAFGGAGTSVTNWVVRIIEYY